MKLTTRTRYAVRALAYLGRRYKKGAITLKEIALREGVNEIMSAVGESFAPVFCVADNKIKNCKRSKKCAARPLWQEMNRVLENFFNQHTLKDFCKNA